MADPRNAPAGEPPQEAADRDVSTDRDDSTDRDESADRDDWAALATHFAEKAAGVPGISLEELDAALERATGG